MDGAVVMYLAALEWIDVFSTSPIATSTATSRSATAPPTSTSSSSTSKETLTMPVIAPCEICGGDATPFPSVSDFATFDHFMEKWASLQTSTTPSLQPQEQEGKKGSSATSVSQSATTSSNSKKKTIRPLMRQVDRDLLSVARSLIGPDKDKQLGTLDTVAKGLSKAVLRHSRTDDVAEAQRNIAHRFPEVYVSDTTAVSSSSSSNFSLSTEDFQLAIHAGRISAATYAATNHLIVLSPSAATTMTEAAAKEKKAHEERLFQQAATFALNRGYCECHGHLPHHHMVPEEHPLDVISVSLADSPKEPSYMVVLDHVTKTCFVTFRGTMSTEDIITDILPNPSVIPTADEVMAAVHGNGDFQSLFQTFVLPKGGNVDAVHYGPEGMVHAGIHAAKVLIPQLAELHNVYTPQGYNFVLTGHSLGSAIANVLKRIIETATPPLRATLPAKIRVIGFASPPMIRSVRLPKQQQDTEEVRVGHPQQPRSFFVPDPDVINFVYGNDIVSRLQLSVCQRMLLDEIRGPNKVDIAKKAGVVTPSADAVKDLFENGIESSSLDREAAELKLFTELFHERYDVHMEPTHHEEKEIVDVLSLRRPFTLPGNVVYISPPPASATDTPPSPTSSIVVPPPRLITDLYHPIATVDPLNMSTRRIRPLVSSEEWLQWHTPVFHQCAVKHHFLFPLLQSMWQSTIGSPSR